MLSPGIKLQFGRFASCAYRLFASIATVSIVYHHFYYSRLILHIYWRILNSYPGEFSYEALKASEPRNELFKAYQEKKVIYCNMKQTAY